MAAEPSAGVRAVRAGLCDDLDMAAGVSLEAATKAGLFLQRENLKPGRVSAGNDHERMIQEALAIAMQLERARHPAVRSDSTRL